MPEKNKIANIIGEVLKIVFVVGMLFVTYYWGGFTKQDGSFDSTMLIFIAVPLFVLGKSGFNLYRNYKYRQK